MTGVEFNQELDLVIDRPYSRYWSPPQRNDFIKQAIVDAINGKTKLNDTILQQDAIFGIYKSNAVFAPTSNEVSLIAGGSGISDYFHMMNLKAKYLLPLNVAYGTSAYVAEATFSTPVRIRVSVKSNLRNGSQVFIAGITGCTNANGVRYLKAISSEWFELYSDVNLLTTVIGNGSYSGTTGAISIIKYNFAKDLKSNRKFSKLNEPTTDNPMYEIADGKAKIYPLERSCTEVTVDYVSTPTFIDVTDASTDLEQVYSLSFLYFIMEQTALLMGMSSRDDQLIQNSATQINQS